MSWKSLGVLAAAFAFCATLTAQNKQSKDPFSGVWELNLAKTTNYDLYASQFIVYVPLPGGGLNRITASVNENKKTSTTEVHPVLFDGKPHQTVGEDRREISYKQPDPYTIVRTQNRDGQITVDKEEVSKDGKTLTITQPSGAGGKGDVRVFNRRADVDLPRN
jgi:hypothetical protein